MEKKRATLNFNSVFGNAFSTTYSVNELSFVDNYAQTPYAYSDTTLFSGKRISKIDVPVLSVLGVDDNQYFTLYVVKSELIKEGGYYNEQFYKQYKVYLPREEITSKQVNKWISIDLSNQFIYVAEDETLAFMNALNPVKLGVLKNGEYGCYCNLSKGGIFDETTSLLFGVYADEIVSLKGKNFSILGASTCTFEGISNNATETNSTIANNKIYYPKGEVNYSEETWWAQAVEATGMELLVNNSWSGAQVLNNDGAGYIDRCRQLHDDAGENSGTNPDIIAVWMGINDFLQENPIGDFKSLKDVYSKNDGYIMPQTVAEAYAIMIHKMVTKYEGAKVFVFTIAPNSTNRDNEMRNNLNNVIKKIAKNFNCYVVDVGNIEGYDYKKHTIEGLHLNEIGMDLITAEFVSVLKNVYAK